MIVAAGSPDTSTVPASTVSMAAVEKMMRPTCAAKSIHASRTLFITAVPDESVAATACVLALGAELVGTSTGLPFGDYTYSGLLGYRIFGLVPFPIPLSWFYMLLGSLVIMARLTTGLDHVRTRWKWALGAGLLMVAWDISMDPAMVKTGHWSWGTGEMFRDSGISAVVAFFTADAFYGMPLSNWFGWLLTAALIARAMLGIIPPARVRAKFTNLVSLSIFSRIGASR